MKTKKILSVCLILIILFANINFADAAPVAKRDWDALVSGGNLKESAVSTAYAAILIDANSGKILFEKHATSVMYPASITKIMTAILAIENSNMADIVTIDNTMAELVNELDDAKLCGFQKNESIYMEDLIYGMMMLSGADAAIAIAVHVGGTYDNFIQMMNDKAAELGMTKTVYKNPHGMYQSGHVTCAEDMAKLAQYAMKFPAFSKVVATGKYTPTDTDKNNYSAKGTVWYNTNKLVNGNRTFGYDYAVGVKTGFTTPSGFTLVSAAEKGNQLLIAVVLKDGDSGRWSNSITMFEYGFEFYDTIDLASEFSDREFSTDVENAASSTSGSQLILQLAPKEKVYLTEKKDLTELILEDIDKYFTVEIEYYDDALIAPVEKGTEVGIVTFTYNNNHYTRDYLHTPNFEDTGIREVKYQALLIAANTVEAMPTITEEPTMEAEATPEPTDTDAATEQEDNSSTKILLFVALALLAIILTMVLSSYLTRRYRYQQYYVKDKKRRERPVDTESDKEENDGKIKFNY